MERAIKELFYQTYGVQPNEMEALSAHGSARKYFRLKSATNSVIGAYNADEKENIVFVDYAKQLADRGLNVPKIIAVDLQRGVYLQEDLGDMTLFQFIKTASEDDVRSVYTKIVKLLPRWQVEATKGFDYTNALQKMCFALKITSIAIRTHRLHNPYIYIGVEMIYKLISINAYIL